MIPTPQEMTESHQHHEDQQIQLSTDQITWIERPILTFEQKNVLTAYGEANRIGDPKWDNLKIGIKDPQQFLDFVTAGNYTYFWFIFTTPGQRIIVTGCTPLYQSLKNPHEFIISVQHARFDTLN